MAALCDVYVNDAFGTAHRAEATTHGIARFAKVACAGPLLAAELEALGKALAQPRRPLVAIVGGAKVSSKLTILRSLAERVDQLIVGGGIANTFLLAAGLPIGRSLAEADLAAEAKAIQAMMQARGADVPIPEDVVCGKASAPSRRRTSPPRGRSPTTTSSSTSAPPPPTATRPSSRRRAPSCGMAPWACSSSMRSAMARVRSPRRSRPRMPSRSPAAATPSPPSPSTA
jgi:hypothetical protein